LDYSRWGRGVKQDIGIEAHDHFSCISSRLNVRKRLPQGKPFRISSRACSIAVRRSTVIVGTRYGNSTATGLPRLVMRTSSPDSTCDSNSENVWFASRALTVFIAKLPVCNTCTTNDAGAQRNSALSRVSCYCAVSLIKSGLGRIEGKAVLQGRIADRQQASLVVARRLLRIEIGIDVELQIGIAELRDAVEPAFGLERGVGERKAERQGCGASRDHRSACGRHFAPQHPEPRSCSARPARTALHESRTPASDGGTFISPKQARETQSGTIAA